MRNASECTQMYTSVQMPDCKQVTRQECFQVQVQEPVEVPQEECHQVKLRRWGELQTPLQVPDERCTLIPGQRKIAPWAGRKKICVK